MDAAPALDQLATPVLWLDGDGRIAGANPACARWLGVSLRRLPGLPLAALEAEGDALARALGDAGSDHEFPRLRRVPMAFPGTEAPRFADLWRLDRRFSPQFDGAQRDTMVAGWKDAVARTLTRRP